MTINTKPQSHLLLPIRVDITAQQILYDKMSRAVSISESTTNPSTFRIRPLSSRTHTSATISQAPYTDDTSIQYNDTNESKSQPGSISARSNVLYNPLELRGLKPSQRALVESYRNQLLQYERERQAHIDRIDDIEGHTGNERMQLRNTVKTLNERVYELQRALSDAHIHLYNERKLLIQTQQNNTELSAHNVEQNKRIQHLLAVTAPVNNETTYFVTSKPMMNAQPHPSNRHATQRTTTQQHSSISLSNNTTHPHQHYGPHSNTADQQQRLTTASERAAQHAADSVSIEQQQLADHTAALQATIKSLRKQLKQQDKLHAQELQAYIEDRALRENDIKNREQEHQQQLNTVIQGVKQVEDRYRNAVRELLQYKSNTNQQIRQLNEQIATLQAENSKSRSDVVAARDSRKQRDTATVEQQRIKQSQAEEDLAIVKQQYAMTQQLYDKRINYLTDRLNTIKQKYDVLSERRDLEFEGFNTDYKQIRERMRQMEHVLVIIRAMIQPTTDTEDIVLPDRLSNQLIQIDKQFQELSRELQAVSQRLQLATT